MSKPKSNRWIRPVGIAATLLVPAVVVAQSVSFAPGEVLSVRKMNDLANLAPSKANVYEIDSIDGPILNSGATGEVNASCRDETDILLSCSCAGARLTNAYEVRRVESNRNGAAASTCNCALQNRSTTTGSGPIRARATCLSVP